MSARYPSKPVSSRSGVSGFTLVELMIAVVLGILVSIGLVTLFGATSKANRVQDALAQLQENGRYASNRLTYDLRLDSRQLMSASGVLPNAPGANGVVSPLLAPQVYAATIPFPDGDLVKPAAWTGALIPAWWPLSPRFFIQAYNCATSCTVPAAVAPAAGNTAAGQRVQGSDVLLVRYLKSNGWSSYNGEVSMTCNSDSTLATLTLTPVTGAPINNPASNFVAGNLALLTYSHGAAYVFPVGVAGNVLTPTGAAVGAVGCTSGATSGSEAKLYNFTTDFITVTYWLQLATDPNNANRLIPTLMRKQSDLTGGAPSTTGSASVPQQLVQGAEQLSFLYGVQAADGTTRYLTADQVQASTVLTCPLPPQQYTVFIPGTMEPNCLWRAVKSIEAHVLLDSVNDMYDLTNTEMAYMYTGGLVAGAYSPYVYDGSSAPPATQAGNINFGRMMRREFVSLVSIRNYNQ